MIKLKDTLYLDADSRQFILKEKMVVLKGKNAGDTYYKEIGYYPTLKTLIRALAERQMYDEVSRVHSLAEIQDKLGEWAESLKTPLVANLRDAVKAYPNC